MIEENFAVGTILGLRHGRAAPDRAGARPYRDVLRRIARKRIPLPERVMDDRNKNLTGKRHESALCGQVGGLDEVYELSKRRHADTPTRRHADTIPLADESLETVCFDPFILNEPSTISLRSLAVHKIEVRQDMVLGFLARNELVASVFA